MGIKVEFDLMNDEPVLFEIMDKSAWLTLNRPNKLNAINDEVRTSLFKLLTECKERKDVNSVVISGSGRAFCSGMELGGGKKPKGSEQWRDRFIEMNRLLAEIVNFPKPTLAKVHGYAIGAGLWLTLACDIAISSDDCKFGTPEIRHSGTPPPVSKPLGTYPGGSLLNSFSQGT